MSRGSILRWLWFVGPLGMSWVAIRSWMSSADHGTRTWIVRCILATALAIIIWIGVGCGLVRRGQCNQSEDT